jgi:hypothetical protein
MGDWRWAVSCAPWIKSSRHEMIRGWVEPVFERCEEEKNLLSLPEIEPRFLGFLHFLSEIKLRYLI